MNREINYLINDIRVDKYSFNDFRKIADSMNLIESMGNKNGDIVLITKDYAKKMKDIYIESDISNRFRDELLTKKWSANKPDNVNSPSHYTQGQYETIEVIEDIVEDVPSYLLGNIIKYVSRYKNKNGIQDLEKAEWYLKRLIEKEKENENKTR